MWQNEYNYIVLYIRIVKTDSHIFLKNVYLTIINNVLYIYQLINVMCPID